MASLYHHWLEPEVRCSCTAATYARLPKGHAQRGPLLYLHIQPALQTKSILQPLQSPHPPSKQGHTSPEATTGASHWAVSAAGGSLLKPTVVLIQEVF